LCTPQAIVEKIAYVMANPVAAGLVRRAALWPGVTTLPEQLGKASWTAQRPDFYFNAENPVWPAQATLQLAPPPIDSMSLEDTVQAVRDELVTLEEQAHTEVRRKG